MQVRAVAMTAQQAWKAVAAATVCVAITLLTSALIQSGSASSKIMKYSARSTKMSGEIFLCIDLFVTWTQKYIISFQNKYSWYKYLTGTPCVVYLTTHCCVQAPVPRHVLLPTCHGVSPASHTPPQCQGHLHPSAHHPPPQQKGERNYCFIITPSAQNFCCLNNYIYSHKNYKGSITTGHGFFKSPSVNFLLLLHQHEDHIFYIPN